MLIRKANGEFAPKPSGAKGLEKAPRNADVWLSATLLEDAIRSKCSATGRLFDPNTQDVLAYLETTAGDAAKSFRDYAKSTDDKAAISLATDFVNAAFGGTYEDLAYSRVHRQALKAAVALRLYASENKGSLSIFVNEDETKAVVEFQGHANPRRKIELCSLDIPASREKSHLMFKDYADALDSAFQKILRNIKR